MTRFFLIILGFKLLIIPACDPNRSDEFNTDKQASIYIKGTLLNLTNEETYSIIRQTENLIVEGENLCDFTVTPELINHIKNNEQFLEINFPQKQFIMSDKFGKIEFTHVMVPLTGACAKPGRITVFYGISGYIDSPVICNNGFHELREMLIGLEYL